MQPARGQEVGRRGRFKAGRACRAGGAGFRGGPGTSLRSGGGPGPGTLKHVARGAILAPGALFDN